MVRKHDSVRRLVVGDEVFFWSVRHHHYVDQGPFRNCREVLSVRRGGSRGRLQIGFMGGEGRLVPDGLLHSGGVGTGGRWLNLHEPGTVRALLDEALSGGGWRVDDPSTVRLDGWDLFDAVADRRESPSSG
ncbi:hypothetical protein HII36_43890 [Nonomuraea sp. NN258]|uniref:hypothetical protein n=1 Tax=Nonomuraea antri TaxID=2730852 RepID=UPI0015682D07|nr:hypothetical protein [Nonomuraea antri]NRQ38722.1 hypothetical protein [Nonomuraea antri]